MTLRSEICSCKNPDALPVTAETIGEMFTVIRDLQDALSKSQAAREWQLIETAPKDGTPIIGGFFSIRWADSHRRHDVVRCWWQPEFEAFISSCREMTLREGLTFEDGTSRQLHSPVIEPVTHWMPFQALPADKHAR